MHGRPVALTTREFALLRLLLERRGEVLPADEISRAIWGYETFGSRNFVESHVSRLRAKLARAGATEVVTTVRGVGYQVPPREADETQQAPVALRSIDAAYPIEDGEARFQAAG